jgi:GGDEF domain-containing protein
LILSGLFAFGRSEISSVQHPQDRYAAALLARADQAMYEAKRKGKNRIAMAPAYVETAETP